MLKEVQVLGVGKLLLALILFLGPGYGLFSFFPNRKRFDKTFSVLLSFSFSVSFWALLLAWLQPLNIRLSAVPVLVIALAGWAVGIFRQARIADFRPVRKHFFADASRFFLWGTLAFIVLAGLWQARDRAVGAGSDSYHHTLIAQLILNQGRLLDNYQPITDQIVTFTYHFGFHVTAAVLGWLSGIPLNWIVLASGMFLIAFSALASAFLTEMVTGSRWGGVAAAVVTGIVCVFPTQMLSWGRYPQLEGLILLTVFIGLLKLDLEEGFDLRRVLFLGFLGAGLGSTHYRASLIAIVGSAALLAAMWVGGRIRGLSWKMLFQKLVVIGSGALVLFLPWIVHVLSTRNEGYSLVVGEFSPTYFSIMRIGAYAVNYPTNLLLLVLAGIAVLWGLLRRDWVIIWVSLWTAACLVFSQPVFAGVFMDFVSVIISLYIPLAVAIGWLVMQVGKSPNRFPAWGKMALGVCAAAVTLWSTPFFAQNVVSGVSAVRADDLKAIEWIRGNTPPSATFMVNLYHFGFSKDLIIALDAGYWLPLLADRKTVSLPMSYMSEKFRTPEGINAIKTLDALNGHLCGQEAEDLLAKNGVSYVYVGSVGGSIRVQELLNCPDFVLEYQHNTAYVFRFASQRGLGDKK